MVKITQKLVKELYKYDSDTGIFTHRTNKGNGYSHIGDNVGSVRPDGYMFTTIDKKQYLLHRLAWLYMEGYLPEFCVDHIDRNPSNNSWNNLRHVSNSCNMRNKDVQKNNKTGVVGVCRHKRDSKWQAQIKVNGKGYHLGFYTDFDDAVKARWDAEVKYGFPNCNSSSTAYNYLRKLNKL